MTICTNDYYLLYYYTMKRNNYKLLICAVCMLMSVVLILGCSSRREDKPEIVFDYPSESSFGVNYPDMRFAVISDLHVYDHSLGTGGAAFHKALNSDRKLLLDSIDLLDYAIETISDSGVSFVIIPGDLTKDGELINHEIVAKKLQKLVNAGIPVYVVPGNHDVNNPDAVRYSEDTTIPVTNVSAEEFTRLHGEYGFNAALFRDDDSLSYVVEPVDGLWLFGLDACRYRENVPGEHAITSGKISQRTADWIAAMLQTAMNHDKAVMAFMHHGVVEHWKGQRKLHPHYLIEGYEDFGKFLASYNVRLVFTGHYHAQDITLGQFDEKYIYDIETGSLVTAPCPIRFVEINNNFLNVISHTIVDELHPGTDFADMAYATIIRVVTQEARNTLKKYKASNKDADYIANIIGDSFIAHYMGDENPALRPQFDKSRLGLWGRVIYSQFKYVLDGLWEDPVPEDNNARFWL